jgi:rSAM/selenodomain-associated transferase 2/rSAM/selenodomain-associated transferase 1
MRLSVVIPTLNEAAALPATLAPLQPLRAAGHEIIVADGRSSDGTRDVATGIADRVVESDRGRAVQMNAGARIAGGDLLVFLHADTLVAADALRRLAATLPASGRRWGRFDVTIAGRSRLLPVVATMMNLRSRLTGIATGDQGIFVDRALFEEIGGFPTLPLMEDVAISRRLKAVAGRPLCLPDRVVTSGRRWDRHGAARTIAAMWRLRFDYWRGVPAAALAARYAPHARPQSPTLQVFAREPVAGEVKTRLARSVGARAAADVYAELATLCFDAAAEAKRRGSVARVELWCTPADRAPRCAEWAAQHGFDLRAQREGDLGTRMREAMTTALARGERVILVGTDCPGIDADVLAAAAAALDAHDAVLVPAVDGGYVALGLARPLDVFADIPWSTPEVAAATRRRLAAAGARWSELPALRDIDDAEDLAWWRGQQKAAGKARSATRFGTHAAGIALVALIAFACLAAPRPATGAGPIAVGTFSTQVPGAVLPLE